jgi:hypothetical protein
MVSETVSFHQHSAPISRSCSYRQTDRQTDQVTRVFPASRYQTCPNGAHRQVEQQQQQSVGEHGIPAVLPADARARPRRASRCHGIPQDATGLKVKLDAKTGLCAAVDQATRIPRGLTPGAISNMPLSVPRYWPKRRPLARAPCRRTLGDLDARANLGWLPPLGPHADMHERFAVTLGRPHPGESAHHHGTTHTTTRAECTAACVPPEVPRWPAMLRRYSQCARAAQQEACPSPRPPRYPR